MQNRLFQSADDLLGPAEGRFFGSRYAAVTGTVDRLHVRHASPHRVQGTAVGHIDFAGLWSRKGTADVQPHLSTVDILSLSMQTIEAAAPHLVAEPLGQLEWTATDVSIKAGAAPVETGFVRLPVEFDLHGQDGELRAAIRVAGFAVDASLMAGPDRPPTGQMELAPSLYGSAYRRRVPSLAHLDVDAPAARATGTASVPVVNLPHVSGIDRARGVGLNQIDAFVAVLQLGQVLLYDVDGLRREDSDTLWMRTTRIRASGPPSTTCEAPVTVTLRDSRQRQLHGDTWRLATIVGEIPDLFDVQCAVAHRLTWSGSPVPAVAAGRR